VYAKGFRGGTISQGSSWSTGWNDSLAVNFNTPNYGEQYDAPHGGIFLTSTWNWDGGTTTWNFVIQISGDTPFLYKYASGAGQSGTPDDWGTW
jgi:hypothetical protein